MARILTVSEGNAQGQQLEHLEQAKNAYGAVPGIMQILLVDPAVAGPATQLYHHLNLRKDSPLSKVQREMIATVVNGIIGGAP